jgi:hypothetical protein
MVGVSKRGEDKGNQEERGPQKEENRIKKEEENKRESRIYVREDSEH